MGELNKVALKHVGKSKFKQVYKNPIPKKIKLMEQLLDLLHEETETGRTVNSVRFDNLCKEFKIRKTKISDTILLFEGPPLETPIVFFWRVGKVKVPGKPETYSNPLDPLILEAPHEGKDNTSRTATRVFEQTNAKILLMNAVHPKIGRQNVRCNPKAYNSDGAHCEKTLFHKVHTKLYEMFPYAFFVQIHGWANNKFLMMCMNAHNNTFTRKMKSGPLLFARAGITVYTERSRKMIFMGDRAVQIHGYRKPGGFHNTCIQARHLNGGNQCKLGKIDRGNFMHVELGQKLIKKSRYYNHNVKKFCENLNYTMVDWVTLEDEINNIENESNEETEINDTENEPNELELESELELSEETEIVEEGIFYADEDIDCDDCEEEYAEIENIEIIEDPDDFVIKPTPNSSSNSNSNSKLNCLKNCFPFIQ